MDRRRVYDNTMEPQMKAEIEKEIEEWANFVENSEEAKKKHAIFEKEK